MTARVAAAVLVITAVALTSAACRKTPPAPVEVVATPEVAKTGLVQMLLATFQRQNGVVMHLRIAPEADALRLAEARGVQVIFTSGPGASARYRHLARLTSTFAFHDFGIFGPARDPAHVRTAGTAVEALRRIEKRKVRFCSAVDVAPIQEREQRLWEAAGVDVKTLRRRSECHGDAIAALREADRKNAYTLSESQAATAAGMNLDIKLLVASSPELHDEYSIVLVDHTPRLRRDKDAEWFVQWLMSYQGRDAVQNDRVDGVPRFSVHDAPGSR